MKRWREHALVIIALVALVATGALATLRTALIDWRFAQAHREPTGQIVVVGIDTAALAAVGVWPWPRSIHAQLLTKLHEAGASEVAFDVDFSSRTNATEDGAFAQALAATGGSAILPVFKQFARARMVRALSLQPARWQNSPITPGSAPSTCLRIRMDVRAATTSSRHRWRLPSLPRLPPRRDARPDGTFFPARLRQRHPPHPAAVCHRRARGPGRRSHRQEGDHRRHGNRTGDHFAAPKYGIVAGVELQALAADSGLQGRMLQQTAWPVALLGLLLIAALASVIRRSSSPGRASYSWWPSASSLETGAQTIQAMTPWVIAPRRGSSPCSLTHVHLGAGTRSGGPCSPASPSAVSRASP